MTELTMQEFRKIYRDFAEKEIGSKLVEPVNIINKGYPYNFNVSFDGLVLRETKSDSLVDIKNLIQFATIQPCIRTLDMPTKRESLLHLSLFDMCGHIVFETDKTDLQKLIEKTITEFFIYYTKYLKLDPKLLIVHYFGGGTLKEISDGKVAYNDFIEPENYSPKIWKALGLKDEQLIKESSRETFLLYTGMPLLERSAGYRNDIFINLNNQKFELTTLHFITYKSVIENERVVGITPLKFRFRGFANGAERCLAAVNGVTNLYELPHIKPLYKLVLEEIINQTKAVIVTDALRTVHCIISDGWTRNKLLGKQFKDQRSGLNKYLNILSEYYHSIGEGKLTELLVLNFKLQSYYPKLKSSIKFVIDEIKEYSEKKK